MKAFVRHIQEQFGASDAFINSDTMASLVGGRRVAVTLFFEVDGLSPRSLEEQVMSKLTENELTKNISEGAIKKFLQKHVVCHTSHHDIDKAILRNIPSDAHENIKNDCKEEMKAKIIETITTSEVIQESEQDKDTEYGEVKRLTMKLATLPFDLVEGICRDK